MKKLYTLLLLILVMQFGISQENTYDIRINEIDYIGLPALEFYIGDSFTDTDHTQFKVELYDELGQSIATTTFQEIKPIYNGNFIVWNYTNGLPNPLPTEILGIAIKDSASEYLEFLSYGGVVTAQEGIAAGQSSKDIITSMPDNATSTSSLQRNTPGDCWAFYGYDFGYYSTFKQANHNLGDCSNAVFTKTSDISIDPQEEFIRYVELQYTNGHQGVEYFIEPDPSHRFSVQTTDDDEEGKILFRLREDDAFTITLTGTNGDIQTFDMPANPYVVNKPASPDMIITGALNKTAGLKFVELYAIQDIPDLSIYTIEHIPFYGSPNPTSSITIGTGSLAAGEYHYVINNELLFNNFFENPSDSLSLYQDNHISEFEFSGSIRLYSGECVLDQYGFNQPNVNTHIFQSYGEGWVKREDNVEPNFGNYDYTEFEIRKNIISTTLTTNSEIDPSYPRGGVQSNFFYDLYDYQEMPGEIENSCTSAVELSCSNRASWWPIYDTLEVIKTMVPLYGSPPPDPIDSTVTEIKVLAEVNTGGIELGTITASLYNHSGPVREDGDGTKYLDRTLFIESETSVPDSMKVGVRFYFTQAELDALINATDASDGIENVQGPNDLVVSHFKGQTCTSAWDEVEAEGVLIDNVNVVQVNGTNGDDGYYAEFETDSFSGFYLHGGILVLPINYLAFTVEKQFDHVAISWTVDKDEAVNYYEVQRSIDGVTFETITERTAVGGIQPTYTILDNSIGIGRYYYRVNAVLTDREADGVTTNVKEVEFRSNEETIVVYQPDTKTIQLYAPSGGANLYSIQGELIFTTDHAQQTSWNASGLAKGLYVVQFENETRKIVVY